MARLEPLGVQAVRSKLEKDHLFVPVLQAPDKMTPNDLVLVWMHGSDDDLEAELASWTDSRGEEQAARELLAFAADGNAATRTAARAIVSRLGQARGEADAAMNGRADIAGSWKFGPFSTLIWSGEVPIGSAGQGREWMRLRMRDWTTRTRGRLRDRQARQDKTTPRPPGGPRTRHPPAEPPAVSPTPALWLLGFGTGTPLAVPVPLCPAEVLTLAGYLPGPA